MSVKKKVGLFFGSFNPIHIGHMIIAQAVVDSGRVDELWFVVSPQNPFKKNNSLLHEFDRLDLVNAAIQDQPQMKASDIEFNLPKPSYTATTLAVLAEKHPQNEFKLIIGEDNLTHFHKWKNYEEILEHHRLIVYPRPNVQKPKINFEDHAEMIEAPMLHISATFIRDSIKNDNSIKYLVPTEVEFLIKSRKFYQ
ncbi:nicotinate (nicotinamide) nucleotide adenylyltransferase [Reichenbachiella ulvae]|uniref:Probable nicotinate-nucleotide adenylyltransferase n=1 Tax=Reichenbachiella ulvae TaxID=2980104 RepID=A0ABT3CVT1_9BACT|nr:nicotinate (nicotinamide) nucleotide adenylyltransferase [Reichenbachiella ulvae]MCV9387697.1 nicotinate (nicotinamide) nucleotide adenylyltransferase [Reichenbachiella ulvae]